MKKVFLIVKYLVSTFGFKSPQLFKLKLYSIKYYVGLIFDLWYMQLIQ